MDMFADLVDQVAFVTGASSGIGHHCALTLAAAGMRVAVGARRIEPLHALVDSIRALGGEAVATSLDVTDQNSTDAAIAAAEAALGPVELLVNNAGTTVSKPALDHTTADWDRVLDTNLKGPFLMATAVARRMRELAIEGSIINIASILGIRQAGQVAAYATSKAGLIQLTRVLALEFARYSIRVNAIAPGYIETDLNRDFWPTAAGQALIKRIPQRRLGAMRDLDGPLLMLASRAGAYVTGVVLPVDGGHLTSSL